jgi:ATP-dependent DNA helicase RecQ
MPATPDLSAILRQYWGYDSFRPLQESIINSLLGGHDTCVVMPTGGGKSLCYQLPAVLLNQTVVVISPLIALMQDQATQLGQMGIPAAVLNSSQPANEQATVIRQARAGDYRLLYLSPERLARPDTIGWLRGVPLAFFPLTRLTAFRNGATSSARNTASSAVCAQVFPISRSPLSPPAPPAASVTTS